MTNEGQLPMMKNMLNSALKAGFDMTQFHCYLLQTNKESASYGTRDFHEITKRKLEVILMNMIQDKEVLWIDNDIYLFENMIENIRKYTGSTFIMQDDLWSPCTGFFLVRSNVFSIKSIRNCISWLQDNYSNPAVNDQHAFDYVYKRTIGLTVTRLPQDEYPNGQVYFNEGRKSKAKMVHCNYLTTTSEKVQRFKENNLWDESDTAFEMVNKHVM